MNANNPEQIKLDEAIKLLKANGYRVTRPFEPRTTYSDSTPPAKLLKAAILDTETTGTNQSTDKIIELGIVVIEYCPETGQAYRITAMQNTTHTQTIVNFQCWALLCMAVLTLPVAAQVQGSVTSPEALIPTPTVIRFSNETLTLPGSEKMGLLGGDLLFDVNDTLRLGGGAYGAVRGSRGGFITLGGAGELRQHFSPLWVGHVGLFVGAGGGRSGNSLTGGGLMLHSDVGLSYETGRYGNLGLGVSQINFPSGLIYSIQPYVQYEYPFYALLERGWNTATFTGGATEQAVVKPEAHEFALVLRTYTISSTVVQDNGFPQYGSMHLLGVEWVSYLDEHWFLKLESEGAIGGKSNGYMQILGGGGYRLALSPTTAIKLQAAAGPAGGGQVDTGGGLLLDTGISLQQNLTRHTALELLLDEVRVPSGSFQARSMGIKLNYQFGLPRVSASPVTWDAIKGFEPQQLRVRMASQTYLKSNPQWRSSFVDQPVSNLGGGIDYFLSPEWYLTGQGLAAFAGQAGDFMTGQVGVGWQWPLSSNWFIEAEALLGAAGGGGLAVGDGVVGQANGNMGYRLSDSLSLIASVGRIEALRGQFKANVVGVSLGYQFSGFTQK